MVLKNTIFFINIGTTQNHDYTNLTAWIFNDSPIKGKITIDSKMLKQIAQVNYL